MSARLPKKGSESKRTLNRSTQFETFESRIVFTVDPFVGNLDQELFLQAEATAPDLSAQVSLIETHQSTGAEYVFNDYGFDGSGQTVAVIDTGIAWDHYALGGGFGEEYRVVGGWDFAEGDADPFDDGPAGFHGTHVTGIIGSSDATNRGVAPGVDLVGLRVFDDAGAGSIEWVEQALQWVHENKDSFENPITTVNLSLGMDWNSDNVPGWATLEDEFAQLEADNIFISVAAGNAFKNYQSTGLAYPAVSEHVVPVASHGMDGELSDFSQRHDRVLVAPGESLQSTVPGHMFGTDTSQSFMGVSGTSMAAPYVAGASAVLREAMGFMGHDNIDQDVLYNHFRETANQFYDAVTGGVYHRIDLGAAVDAVITDAHGEAASTATNLGTIDTGLNFSGTIGKQTDVDAISFTAGSAGEMTLRIEQTHQLDASVRINGQNVAVENGFAKFDVIAGQKYTLSLSTDSGIGHYSVVGQVKASISATELGQVVSARHSVSVSGEEIYAVEATRDGYLTASVDDTNMRMEIYDSSMNLVASSTASGGQLRTDAVVNGGQRYFVKLVGNDSDASLSLNNQVSFTDGFLNVVGSQGDDSIALTHGAADSISLQVGGHTYQFDGQQVSGVGIEGLQGADSLQLNLEHQNDQVWLSEGEATVSNGSFQLNAKGFENISVDGDSTDRVTLYDSAGNDRATLVGDSATLVGERFTNQAFGFGGVQVFASSGLDQLEIIGSNDVDQVSVSETGANWLGSNGFRSTNGFDEVQVDGAGGDDALMIHGLENASFDLDGQNAIASLNGTSVNATGFEKIAAIAHRDGATAILRGTDGDDAGYSDQNRTALEGEGYQNNVYYADAVVLEAGAGSDSLVMHDSNGDDTVTANHYSVAIGSAEQTRTANGFENSSIIANGGGTDHVVFTGTQGRDVLYSEGSSSFITTAGKQIGMIGFDSVNVIGNGGHDSVFHQGDGSNTSFQFDGVSSVMTGDGYNVTATDFDVHRMNGGLGQNTVHLSGFGQSENDRLTADGSALLAYLDGTTVKAENFVWLEAEVDEDKTSTKEIGAVDFWYALHGDWEEQN